MKYLLDTCVVSELVRRKPEARVVTWVSDQEETSLFLSARTFGALQKGIERREIRNKLEIRNTKFKTRRLDHFSCPCPRPPGF